jgi:hypothetical protein
LAAPKSDWRGEFQISLNCKRFSGRKHNLIVLIVHRIHQKKTKLRPKGPTADLIGMLNFRVRQKREGNLAERTRLLELALKGLEAERAKIDDEIAQIRSQLNHGAVGAATAGSVTVPKKKTMSAAARKRISQAMKRRYAAMKNAAITASAPAKVNERPMGGGSRLTAAGRKKLSDLMKKRWAERRKGKTK